MTVTNKNSELCVCCLTSPALPTFLLFSHVSFFPLFHILLSWFYLSSSFIFFPFIIFPSILYFYSYSFSDRWMDGWIERWINRQMMGGQINHLFHYISFYPVFFILFTSSRFSYLSISFRFSGFLFLYGHGFPVFKAVSMCFSCAVDYDDDCDQVHDSYRMVPGKTVPCCCCCCLGHAHFKYQAEQIW